jgi:alanine dehydrogenase
MNNPTPLESPADTSVARRSLTIGLPQCVNSSERRFPLTPEAVATLVDRGFAVVMEENAARHIHYTDNAYVRAGARIVSRCETLEADIVIHLAPLPLADISCLRRGALLLSLANFARENAKEVIRRLLDRKVINIAIDLIADESGHHPFADILSEIDGRTAMVLASAIMADPRNGKGILLGGVAGVMPCEVVILGSNLGACAAARSAIGLGALVRMFDDDNYRLRRAIRRLGEGVIGSSVHPNALENAMQSADIIIATSLRCRVVVDAEGERLMKKGALIFDLTDEPGKAFPAMPLVDLGAEKPHSPLSGRHCCHYNVGSAVPRTAAMALSDTFITMLDDIAGCGACSSAIQLTGGLQKATLTFLGTAVNRKVADIAGVRYTDINLLLSLS